MIVDSLEVAVGLVLHLTSYGAGDVGEEVRNVRDALTEREKDFGQKNCDIILKQFILNEMIIN